jgi:3-methyladenine DNA glycosylase/8-oxoguanine DNA glycosylase
LPFSVNPAEQTLERILELPDGFPVRLVMKGGNDNEVEVVLEAHGTLSEEDLKFIETSVRYFLSMDADLSALHELVEGEAEFRWIATANAGRLLRSPTVFEDLVKTLCTTNTTWKQTKKMVLHLCESLGTKLEEDGYSFPRASKIASSSQETLRAAGLGYRAQYLLDVAARVLSGELNVEAWAHSNVPTEELLRTMATARGIGSYACANMLRLLGRTEHIHVENWMIRTFSMKRNAGKVATSSDLVQYYSRFGKWKGVVLWLDTINVTHAESN